MKIEISLTEPSETELVAIKLMLEQAFEGDFADSDWEHTFSGIRFIGSLEDEVICHGALIPRQIWLDGVPKTVGYLEGLAVLPSQQGKGFGSELMFSITEYAIANYEFSMLSSGLKQFYRKFGWQDFLGHSYVKVAGESIPTYEEDSELMFLIGMNSGLQIGRAHV